MSPGARSGARALAGLIDVPTLVVEEGTDENGSTDERIVRRLLDGAVSHSKRPKATADIGGFLCAPTLRRGVADGLHDAVAAARRS